MPNEFLQVDEFSVDNISKLESSATRGAADDLLRVPLVWVHRGSILPPLACPYDGLFTVIRCGQRSFAIRAGTRDKIVSISRLKPCTAADAKPDSPRRRSRPPGSGSAVKPAATHLGGPPPLLCGSLLQTSWPLLLHNSGRHKTVPEPFSPSQRAGFCMPGTDGHYNTSTAAESAAPAETAGEV